MSKHLVRKCDYNIGNNATDDKRIPIFVYFS